MKPNKQKRLGKAGSRFGMVDEFLGLSTARPAMSVFESHPPESNRRPTDYESLSSGTACTILRRGVTAKAAEWRLTRQ